MKIYYYKKNNTCPVKDYLKKFDNELLADIDGKIKLIAENGTMSPPLAKPLKEYPFSEITKPYKKIAIRLLCAEIKKELILLHAFDKPRYYKANDKKINSQITKNYNIALNYYNEIKNYENYKEEYK
jgi:hypothetical protein